MIRLLLSILSVGAVVNAYNILVIVPIPTRSHIMLFEPLVVELGRLGHQVTYIAATKLGKPAPNVTEITISGEILGPDGKPLDFLSVRHLTAWDNIFVLPQIGLKESERVLSSPEFQDLLRRKPKFDLLICEAFSSESVMAGVSRYFNIPLIGYQTFMPSAWTNYMVGNIAPTSHIPDPLLGKQYGMKFWDRLENFVFTIISELYQSFYYFPKQDALLKKYFGDDEPYVEDVVRNMSVLLINDHLSTAFPRPSVPNMISIGGLHVRQPKPLPQDLSKYLDESKNGAILFSLGSIIKASNMPADKIQMFLNAFSKLNLNILWKFEGNIPNVPKNVKISNWLPQSDILAHPNIKLFITHGGLLSTTEAIDRGVPIVGIPFFGDQPMNMKQSVNNGVGLSLNYDSVTEEDLLAAIREVLGNPRFQDAASKRSARYHDRPLPPMELAIYWIEYVIRHQGAGHLRSEVQDLRWYEAHQLDVAAVLLLPPIIFLYVICRFVSSLIKCFSSKPQSQKKKKKQ